MHQIKNNQPRPRVGRDDSGLDTLRATPNLAASAPKPVEPLLGKRRDLGAAQSIMGVDLFLLRVDATGGVHYINSAFARHLGSDKGDLTGLSLARLRRSMSPAMREVVQPPQSAEGALHSIRDGGRTYAVRVTPVLEGGFDVVMQDISEQEGYRAKLERYVSPVLLELAEGLEEAGELQTELSVVFCDLRGFTKYSESVGPEKTRDLLNVYLEQSIVSLEEHQGTIDKIVGDEVMALFGLQDGMTREDALLLSLTAAGDTIARLRQHYADAFPGEKVPLCGIGMHHGEVALAAIGSSNRQDVTALGPTVNLASRLCSIARAGEILISAETMVAALAAAPEGWEIVEGRLAEPPSLRGIGGKQLGVEEPVGEERGRVHALVPTGKVDFQNGALLFYSLAQVSFKGVSEPLQVVSVVAGPDLASLAGTLRMKAGVSLPKRRATSTMDAPTTQRIATGEIISLLLDLRDVLNERTRVIGCQLQQHWRISLAVLAVWLVLLGLVTMVLSRPGTAVPAEFVEARQATNSAAEILQVFSQSRATRIAATFYEAFPKAREAFLLGEISELPAEERGVARLRIEREAEYREKLVRRGGARLLLFHLESDPAQSLGEQLWNAGALKFAAAELRNQIDLGFLQELAPGLDENKMLTEALRLREKELTLQAFTETNREPTGGTLTLPFSDWNQKTGAQWAVAREVREYLLRRCLARKDSWPDYVCQPVREKIAGRQNRVREARQQLRENPVALARLEEEAVDWRLIEDALDL